MKIKKIYLNNEYKIYQKKSLLILILLILVISIAWGVFIWHNKYTNNINPLNKNNLYLLQKLLSPKKI